MGLQDILLNFSKVRSLSCGQYKIIKNSNCMLVVSLFFIL